MQARNDLGMTVRRLSLSIVLAGDKRASATINPVMPGGAWLGRRNRTSMALFTISHCVKTNLGQVDDCTINVIRMPFRARNISVSLY